MVSLLSVYGSFFVLMLCSMKILEQGRKIELVIITIYDVTLRKSSGKVCVFSKSKSKLTFGKEIVGFEEVHNWSGSIPVLATRIVNGANAEIGEFPYAVSLRYNSTHTCGGTILNENFILTAAHCACNDNKPRDAKAYSIQYGLTEITTDSVNTRNVKKINCRNDFHFDKNINDCAVIELEKPLPKDDTWKSVAIADEFSTEKPQTGVIIGWGQTGQNDSISRTLQQLEVEIYDDETCSQRMDNTHHICFGAMNGGACMGDSGTALLVDNKQVGIASFITNICGIANKKDPNVYSRIPTYYKWITDIMAQENSIEESPEEE